MALLNESLARTVISNGTSMLKNQLANDARFSTQLSAIRQWISEKKQNLLILDETVTKLLGNASLLGSQTDLKFDNYDSDDNGRFVEAIPPGTLDEVVEGMNASSSRWRKVYGANMPLTGISLTDAQGYSYCLSYSEPTITLPNGDTVQVKGLSYVTDPHDYHDMFIMKLQDGSELVNPLMKSIGYFRVGGSAHDRSSVWSTLLEIQDLLDVPVPLANIRDTLEYLTGDTGNLDFLVGKLLLRYGLDGTGVLYDDLNSCCDKIFSEWAEQNTGVLKYAGDVLHDVANNNSMIQVLSDTCDGLFNDNLSGFLTSMREKYRNYSSVVKDMLNDISEAYNVGGFYGVMSYIISIIKGEGSIRANGSKLEFTDNSSLVPAQYIGGIICSVLGTVAQIAGVVIFAFSKIAGAIVNVIGNILLAIPKAFSWDYSSTNAAVNGDKYYTFDMAPHATLQNEVAISNSGRSILPDIYAMIKDNNSPVICQVPGGYLLIGLSDKDSYLRYEFHPSSNFVPLTNLRQLFSIASDKKTGTWKTCKTIVFGASPFNPDSYYQAWAKDYENARAVINQNLGRLSDEDDRTLRISTICNTTIFYMWLFLMQNKETLVNKHLTVVQEDWNGGPTPDSPWFDFEVDLDHFVNLFVYFVSTPKQYDQTDHTNFSWTRIAQVLFSSDNSQKNDLEFKYWYNTGTSYPTGASSTFTFNIISSLNAMLNRDNTFFYGDVTAMPNVYNYYFSAPKYDKSTFIMWVLVATAIVVAATVVAVVSTVKVKKAIQNKRAKLTSQVSNNWENYTNSMKEYDASDPDDDPSYHTPAARKAAYAQYFKSVKSNNRWQMVLGGTKYSTAGYWDSDESYSADSETGSSFMDSVKEDGTTIISEFNGKNDIENDFANDLSIYQLIKGVNL